MKENTVLPHPFVGNSYFPLHSNDQLFSDAGHPQDRSNVIQFQYDRHSDFVVDDSPEAGIGCFHDVKTLGRGQNDQKMTALAVREHGSRKQARLIRFIHGVRTLIHDSLQDWAALNHTWNLDEYLYNQKTEEGIVRMPRDDDPILATFREDAQFTLLSVVDILTAAQRCADWRSMSQFRLTSTSAATLLLKRAEYRDWMCLPKSQIVVPSPTQVLESLSKFWFTSTRSTEKMMRGTVNEDAVLKSLGQNDFLKALFKVWMVCSKPMPWLGCSPDVVTMFDSAICKPEELQDTDENQTYKAIVEINTLISSNSVARRTQFASADLTVCDIESLEFQQRVPTEHAAQIVHLCVVFNAERFFYICASESQILYTVLSSCPKELHILVREYYSTCIKPALSWAHSSPMEKQIHTGNQEIDETIKSQITFWKPLDTTVHKEGPFLPVRMFKHSSQTIYNKTKRWRRW